jgi:hypothetical protein
MSVDLLNLYNLRQRVPYVCKTTIIAQMLQNYLCYGYNAVSKTTSVTPNFNYYKTISLNILNYCDNLEKILSSKV